MSNNVNGGGGGQTQTSGAGVITSPNSDTRTLNHRGTEVGMSNVALEQNDPGRPDSVLTWTVPKKYKLLVIAGGKHFTKAELRSYEEYDGDGSQTQFTLNENLIAVAGERHIEDQPFPSVVAYDSAAGSELTISDINYNSNTVTFDSPPDSGTDNVRLWPVMGDGTVAYRGLDAFGNAVGPLDEWGVPIHVFADFDTEKNMTQVYLPGAARFDKDEELSLYVDAPRSVVWEDPQDEYPRGQYVSRVEQRADIQV